MTTDDAPLKTIASLRRYLEELKETGVEGLPFSPAPAVERVTDASPAVPFGEERRHSPETVPQAPPVESVPVRETIEEIRRDLGECHRCDLGKGRSTLVFGVGNPHARLVFVGEAPGRDEDIKGEPFVGEAGQLLTRLITRMGIARQDVYICNVLKCRPPGNRNPEPLEIELCSPFLLRQVRAIGPEVIVALGTFAAQTLLGTKAPISKLRGHFHDYHGIPLMPTFHPSFLLHNRNDKEKFWTVWEDMIQVMKLLKMPVPDVKRRSEGAGP